LNLPKVDWSVYTGLNHEVYRKFLNFVLESSYSQLIHFPTRDNNILDIILTTEPSMFVNVRSDVPIGSSELKTFWGRGHSLVALPHPPLDAYGASTLAPSALHPCTHFKIINTPLPVIVVQLRLICYYLVIAILIHCHSHI